jgi:hypothetical protein
MAEAAPGSAGEGDETAHEGVEGGALDVRHTAKAPLARWPRVVVVVVVPLDTGRGAQRGGRMGIPVPAAIEEEAEQSVAGAEATAGHDDGAEGGVGPDVVDEELIEDIVGEVEERHE